jgi:hypothetical protein
MVLLSLGLPAEAQLNFDGCGAGDSSITNLRCKPNSCQHAELRVAEKGKADRHNVRLKI